jgi:putative ABC transport system permease protein
MKTPSVTPLSKLACFWKIMLQGVWINRFQLILTTLTMSFGSLGLALTIFLGDGAQKSLWVDLSNLLGSWAVISPDAGPNMELLKTRINPFFTEEDYSHIKQEVKNARLVSPAIFDKRVSAQSNQKKSMLFLDAITPQLGREKLFHPLEGRSLSASAYAMESWECLATRETMKVLGVKLKDHPFVLLDGYRFRIVGIIKPPPLTVDRFRERVVVPYKLARQLWMPPGDMGEIVVAWRDNKDMGEVFDQIKTVLNKYRGPQTYVLSSSQFQIQSGRNIVHTFVVVGATQSLFCILIASIGVLNVMLTNVSRRTHEFAIRIAMGARQQEILTIVLSESIFVGLIGAAIGLIIALFSAPIISGIMSRGIREMTHLTPAISLKGILTPLLLCGICSLIAGVIPALKVRRVDILSALRENL